MIKRLKDLKKTILESQVWRSMFRHDYADTPRNRTLQIMSNVWMHLHPPKVRRHAIRIRFTWCMGGINFLLFLVLTVTGVVLMFYYRPVAEYAYADMKYLQFDVPFGMLVRNMHRWAATVGTNMARATPLLGHEGPFAQVAGVTPRYDARAFLLGGTIVGPPTLLRFYVLHCIFL